MITVFWTIGLLLLYEYVSVELRDDVVEAVAIGLRCLNAAFCCLNAVRDVATFCFLPTELTEAVCVFLIDWELAFLTVCLPLVTVLVEDVFEEDHVFFLVVDDEPATQVFFFLELDDDEPQELEDDFLEDEPQELEDDFLEDELHEDDVLNDELE